MQDTWEDTEEHEWPEEAQEWYHRQLDGLLRSFLCEQPAFMEALAAASPNQRDPYRDGLERVTDWYLKRPPMVGWADDPVYRPETLGGGWRLLPGMVRAALIRAVKEVLAEIEAEREAGQRYDELRVAAWIKAEQTGTLPPAPVEASRAALLAQARGSWGDRGEP